MERGATFFLLVQLKFKLGHSDHNTWRPDYYLFKQIKRNEIQPRERKKRDLAATNKLNLHLLHTSVTQPFFQKKEVKLKQKNI